MQDQGSSSERNQVREATVKLNEAPKGGRLKTENKESKHTQTPSLTKGTKPSVALSASDPTSVQTRWPHFHTSRCSELARKGKQLGERSSKQLSKATGSVKKNTKT